MSQNPPDMKIRLSAELRQHVEAAAKRNNRTMNSEIVSRLEASFRDAGASGASSDEPAISRDEYIRLSDTVMSLRVRVEKLEASATAVSGAQ